MNDPGPHFLFCLSYIIFSLLSLSFRKTAKIVFKKSCNLIFPELMDNRVLLILH